MKLSSALVERTLTQFDARVIPDTHPVIPQLNRMFGEHTFFLDGRGLSIVEPAEPMPGMEQAAKVVIIADWEDENRSSLAPHEPLVTEKLVELGPQRGTH